MKEREFAALLVSEVISKCNAPEKTRAFHQRNGIDTDNLADADQIWILFARYNLETGGMRSTVCDEHWESIPKGGLIRNRLRLMEAVECLSAKKCFENFTTRCPVLYTNKRGFDMPRCVSPDSQSICPVIGLTREISWHRKHIRISKILAECAKRFLLLHDAGRKSGNLNDVVASIFEKHLARGGQWKRQATREFLDLFKGIAEYGSPPKVVALMLSDLASTLHGILHWPDFDLNSLVPVDTHVRRLSLRFGFVSGQDLSSENIGDRIAGLYPQEPRRLDFALFKLASDYEDGVCGSEPNCPKCQQMYRLIWESCPARRRF